MVAAAIAAERCARVAWSLFTCLAIAVMLSEIVRAAASGADKDVGRAARTWMTPRLALPAKRLRRKFHPSFARTYAP